MANAAATRCRGDRCRRIRRQGSVKPDIFRVRRSCGHRIAAFAECRSEFSESRPITPSDRFGESPASRTRAIRRMPRRGPARYPIRCALVTDLAAHARRLGVPRPETPIGTHRYRAWNVPAARKACHCRLPSGCAGPRSPLHGRRAARSAGASASRRPICRRITGAATPQHGAAPSGLFVFAQSVTRLVRALERTAPAREKDGSV